MKTFTDIFAAAKACPPKKVVVAAAQDKKALEAVKGAFEEGLAQSILVGDMNKIEQMATEIGLNLKDYETVHEPDIAAAAKRAVVTAHTGKADIVVKGAVNSSVLLRTVLDKNIGLRTGRGLCQVTVFEVPGEPRLMLMTDAGMNISPTLEQKIDMVKNTVCVARSLHFAQPKVAVIAGAELVNPDMPSSLDAALLAKMGERGQIKGCVIDGPLSLDLAVSPAAVEAKGVISPVAGQADILVLPDIDAGNVFYKTMAFLAKTRIASIIAGAKVPITLPSRADTYEAKLASIALGVLMATKSGHGVRPNTEKPVIIEYINQPSLI